LVDDCRVQVGPLVGARGDEGAPVGRALDGEARGGREVERGQARQVLLDLLLGIGDVMTGLVKSVVFGIVMALASCQFGLGVTGGAPGVGRAVNATVVASAAGIFVLDYFVSFTLP
jgi:hypothetical protein